MTLFLCSKFRSDERGFSAICRWGGLWTPSQQCTIIREPLLIIVKARTGRTTSELLANSVLTEGTSPEQLQPYGGQKTFQIGNLTQGTCSTINLSILFVLQHPGLTVPPPLSDSFLSTSCHCSELLGLRAASWENTGYSFEDSFPMPHLRSRTSALPKIFLTNSKSRDFLVTCLLTQTKQPIRRGLWRDLSGASNWLSLSCYTLYKLCPWMFLMCTQMRNTATDFEEKYNF